MFSVAALSPAAATTTAAAVPMNTLFSPSKHPFMKRTAEPNRFCFDPYKTARKQMDSPKDGASSAVVSLPAVAANSSSQQNNTLPPTTSSGRAGAGANSSSILPTPTISHSPAVVDYRLVHVSFKHTIAPFKAHFRVAEGDKVIVEGDRGEHMGVVSSILPSNTTAISNSKIIRRATAADLEAFAAKSEKELAVIAEVTKIAKEVRLNASIADVEFQLDLNKLTIFVERATTTTFVDFRKLQRTLFKMFHCRIWFVYMDEVNQ